MLKDVPFTRDLVLVGGGHAHALILKAWGMDPLPGVRLTVINPGPTAPYTGMLPGYVAGHYQRDDLEIDLVRLCQHAGARLILDKAIGIDREVRKIVLQTQPDVMYDVGSIDVGITAEMDVLGFSEHGIGAKPLDRYAEAWQQFLKAVSEGKRRPEVAVIGGGVAGCELALAMAFALKEVGAAPQVTVIERGPGITGVGARAGRRLQAEMATSGVTVLVNATVKAVEAGRVTLIEKDPVAAVFCVGAAGAFAHHWIAQTDLPQKNGFIEVDPDLGVQGDRTLFAVGDCANMSHAPRPKAGVFAVRAAPVLHHNLRATLSGQARRTFKPQKNYLKLISLGGKSAMAEKFGIPLSGPWMWRWKDRIDRAFMQRLEDLPLMARPAPTGDVALGVRDMLEDKPLCGGCGAKVGGAVLGQVLAGLPDVKGDVVTGAGDDAAVLAQPGGGFQVISTDHLRGMIHDHALMARIAAVHALGDVWAMGAVPQVMLASLVLPRMAPALQVRTLAEITRAARDVASLAGAQLVGGHTTMGAELTIGFTVTGTRNRRPITIDGAKAGDVLLLTRPIGSGVIMAALMQGGARGPDVVAALATMAQPQHLEAHILGHAHAMTDVTGFGLAGHVAAMARASGLGVTLMQSAIPVYAGARALSQAGVASSLMPANRENGALTGLDDPLLYDPQTAGGLLAALPEEDADAALTALAAAGCEGHIIGRFDAGKGTVKLG